jgi:hypothetical protein
LSSQYHTQRPRSYFSPLNNPAYIDQSNSNNIDYQMCSILLLLYLS